MSPLYTILVYNQGHRPAFSINPDHPRSTLDIAYYSNDMTLTIRCRGGVMIHSFRFIATRSLPTTSLLSIRLYYRPGTLSFTSIRKYTLRRYWPSASHIFITTVVGDPCNLPWTSLQPLKHVYKVMLGFIAPWRPQVQGWTFRDKGWHRLGCF